MVDALTAQVLIFGATVVAAIVAVVVCTRRVETAEALATSVIERETRLALWAARGTATRLAERQGRFALAEATRAAGEVARAEVRKALDEALPPPISSDDDDAARRTEEFDRTEVRRALDREAPSPGDEANTQVMLRESPTVVSRVDALPRASSRHRGRRGGHAS